MRTHSRATFLGLLVTLAFGAAAFALHGTHTVQAALAPVPCAGNVCTGSITVGGQAVQYAYTQHLVSNGQFRIRFNGGAYNTSQLVSFIVYDLPAFTATGYLANPTNGAQAMTESDVNPGNTAYERRDSDGCPSCIFDHVMSVQYATLPAGTYAFSFTVVQNGGTGGLVSVPFYVDGTAPTNANESTAWTGAGVPSNMDFPCADNVDNDLDFTADCADPQCAGFRGQVATAILCQIPENSCDDSFDNDADGKIDCLDPDCDGHDGLPGSGVALCQYGNEYGIGGTCGDSFDNDGDGYTDCVDNTFNVAAGGNSSTICWKKPAYGCPAFESCTANDTFDEDKDMSYSSAWDTGPLTGTGCRDYDCAGSAFCPAKENLLADGTDADAQCFDGLDNDLDHLVDCADPDCTAIINPGNPTQGCYEKEFDLGQRYQFCSNSFDDDGDTPKDCDDTDCSRRFGNCGPCPAREDYTFNSCADGRDNDSDAGIDCGDIDCQNRIGTLGSLTVGAAQCSAAENDNSQCSDGFDNDSDGTTDCADAGCAGKLGPNGVTCEAVEASCGDGKDNDGDGRIDCVDTNCAGIGSCAAASWVQAASCRTVPSYSGPTAFTGSGPTVTAVVSLTQHVSSQDSIRLIGSGTYSSVTVIVGDNTDPAAYYPYADAGCALTDTASGSPAARFAFTVVSGHAVQIFNTSGSNIVTFDITLKCATPAVPATVRSYPISLSALKSPGDVQEYGDASFSTTLYENTPPTVSEVEAEGEISGVVKVPYGGTATPSSRRMRGVPNDPGVGLYTSGICRCDLDVSGTSYATTADCVSSPIAFTSDATLAVRGRAEDGAGNLGGYSASQPYTVNVTPVLATALSLSPSSPYFRSGDMTASLSAAFVTGGSDFFAPSCDVYVRDTSGNVVNGPTGPTFSFAGVAVGNTILCSANPTLPGMNDGMYYLTIKVADSDGDTVESNRRVLYMCNAVPAAGDAEPAFGATGYGCQYADFDRDGAAEGLYTTVYSTAPKACDNCVGLANSNQSDTNANGVGDLCEPTDEYGRCEIDTDIVCLYNSNDTDHGCPSGDNCCPGPSIGIDYSVDLSPAVPAFQPKDPQFCKKVWGLCTLGGEVCFDDPNCPGGKGLCQDSLTACYRDTDCLAVSGTPACTGADRCENLLFPWLQTVYGNIFSKKRITAPDLPPANQYNATYCIVAKDVIVNFRTAGQGNCTAMTDSSVRYELPKASNAYSTVLGKVDLAGLRGGRYGEVVQVSPASQLDTVIGNAAGHLGGKVFRVTGDATLGAHTFMNDVISGAGTIFVDGGNLTIVGDLTYDTSSVGTLRELASLGIIVVPDSLGNGGNLSVNGLVTTAVGATYLGGTDGFSSVALPDVDSPAKLTWYGLMVARQFHLSRSYKSLTEGAENFIYDGRAVVNPPPGFADVTRALPVLGDTVVP